MDPIANFLTSIRNASAKGLEKADAPYSKIKLAIAKILKEEGFIQTYRTLEEHQVPFIRVQLKYLENREPVLQGIKKVSTPGLRIYENSSKISRVNGGLGVSILTTSKGLMTHRKAKQMKVGGEVLCHVW